MYLSIYALCQSLSVQTLSTRFSATHPAATRPAGVHYMITGSGTTSNSRQLHKKTYNNNLSVKFFFCIFISFSECKAHFFIFAVFSNTINELMPIFSVAMLSSSRRTLWCFACQVLASVVLS